MIKYRYLEPDELVEEGDEYQEPCSGNWVLAANWQKPNKEQSQFGRYRRPVLCIETRLQELAIDMHAVAMWMQCDDNSDAMRAKGVQLQGAAAMVWNWYECIQSEKTIQTFIDGKKEVVK